MRVLMRPPTNRGTRMKTYFGMFTDEGNAEVSKIVAEALDKRWGWNDITSALFKLAKDRAYREAADTAVRDEVYVALVDLLNLEDEANA